MKQLITLFSLSLLIFSISVQAQTTDIKGVVFNEQKPMEFSTAVLLTAKDSVIQSFSLSDKSGNFKLTNIPKGDFILQVTYVGFKTSGKNISIDGTQKEILLDTIHLEKTSSTLNDVVIEGEKIPVQMNGDTVQYNADAFKTQPNATVEDLLKKLPGVNVDKDGNVKAQGETVTKVTVDGKEFFSDDPKVATKNLPADAIDKVQVFDAKSETADFTGVDDGEHEKTINLKLKPGKKSGTFGNATVGYGTEDRYYGKFSYNRFTATNKISILGLANNTNEQGFSWQDITSFSGGMQSMMDNNLMFNYQEDMGSTWLAQKTGVTDNVGGGINFNTTAIKKVEVNGNYLLNYTDNTLNQNSVKNYTGFENGFTNNSETYQRNFNLSHRGNVKLTFKPNDNNKLTLRGNVNYITADKNQNAQQENLILNQLVQSSSLSFTQTDANVLSLKASANYLKRFKKKGRTLVFDGSWSIRNSNNSTDLNTLSSGLLMDTTSGNYFTSYIFQNQISINDKDYYGGKISYTEPMSEESVLEFSYQKQNNAAITDKTYNDINPLNHTIVTLNDSLSTNYRNDYTYDRGGLKFRWNHNKMNLSFGGVVQNSVLNGNSDKSETPIKKTYLEILPSLQLNQKFTNARINISYNTKITEPSIDQLQPVVDNSNPLSIYKGNPDLAAAYSHSLNVNYNFFSQYNSIGLSVFTSASYTKGNIVNSVTYDSSFVEITQPINTDYQKAANAYMSFSFPLNFVGCKIELEPDISYTNGLIFLNGTETGYYRTDNTYGASLSNKKKDVVDWEFGGEYSLNQTHYNTAEKQEQQYSSYNYYTEWELDLDHFTLATDFNYDIYNEAAGDVQKIPLWNASASFQFLKNDRAEIKLAAYDLLDKDNGIYRSANLNYIQQTTVNTLGRYFLLKFTWNLSKSGANMGMPGNMKFKMK